MWKDTKTALIVFNMNVKNFESIRRSILHWIVENSISFSELTPNSWKCTICRKDKKTMVQLVIALYDLSL